ECVAGAARRAPVADHGPRARGVLGLGLGGHVAVTVGVAGRRAILGLRRVRAAAAGLRAATATVGAIAAVAAAADREPDDDDEATLRALHAPIVGEIRHRHEALPA